MLDVVKEHKRVSAWRWSGWWGIRAFGWQFDVVDHRERPPVFAERFGDKPWRGFHLGPFCVRLPRRVEWLSWHKGVFDGKVKVLGCRWGGEWRCPKCTEPVDPHQGCRKAACQ